MSILGIFLFNFLDTKSYKAENVLSRIVLPDESIVWLDTNSKLKYKDSDGQRSLTLDGRAYFDVKKGPDQNYRTATLLWMLCNSDDGKIPAKKTKFIPAAIE